MTGPASNWIILQDGADFTLIDCGYPTDLPHVLASVEYLGLRIQDAASLLITHGHADHIGTAKVLTGAYSIPALADMAELPNVTGQDRSQVTLKQVLGQSWNPRIVRWAVHALKAGGLDDVSLADVQPFPHYGALDVPGAPVPVPTPGHTPGHTSFHLPALGVLVTGDALVTSHPTTGWKGPQMLRNMFHDDKGRAVASLPALAACAADVYLPGHGPVIRGPILSVLRSR